MKLCKYFQAVDARFLIQDSAERLPLGDKLSACRLKAALRQLGRRAEARMTVTSENFKGEGHAISCHGETENIPLD